jgi:hypothetical protein
LVVIKRMHVKLLNVIVKFWSNQTPLLYVFHGFKTEVSILWITDDMLLYAFKNIRGMHDLILNTYEY